MQSFVKYLSVSLSIITLLVVIVGCLLWTRAYSASVQAYQPPILEQSPTSTESALPQTAKVVVVLVSGLGELDLQTLEMPTLSQLAQTGASTVLVSQPPTYSKTARMTLVSGASAELNGAPLTDQPQDTTAALQIDNLFARVKAAGYRTALLGLADWRTLVPRANLDETFFVEFPGPEADQTILGAALPLLSNGQTDLVLIQFSSLQLAATRLGSSAPAYAETATAIDGYIEEIRRSVDLNNTTLIILGDHGHIGNGGYGGAEPEVIRQPLVMIGHGVNPGSYSNVSQVNVAPTIAALLGAAPPSAAEGRILFEMLTLDEISETSKSNRAVAQLQLARQRVALAETYLNAIGVDPNPNDETLLPGPLVSDLERAEATFANNNISGAYQLALLTQQNADTLMAASRLSRLQAERWPRLFIAALMLLLWGGLMWQRRGLHAGLIIIATLITVALYHMLFQAQGYSYSISTYTDLSQIPFDVGRRIVVSMMVGGGLVMIVLMLVSERNWLVLLGTGYGFSLLVTFSFALPLFWVYWQNGVTIGWYIPSIVTVFWQVTGLFETLNAAIVGLILPWPMLGVNLIVNLARRHLGDNRPQPESEPLPGLRP